MPKRSVTDTLEGQPKPSQKSRRRTGHTARSQTDPNLKLKTEAARALGLWDKVKKYGWGALTAAESGAVGGYMTRVKFAARRKERDSPNNSS